MIVRRLVAPLAAAFVTLHAGQAAAQGAFPAPLPSQSFSEKPFPAPLPNQQSVPASPAPPVDAAPVFPPPLPSDGAGPLAGAPRPSDSCMKGFIPLREGAEKRSKLLKAASDRKAAPMEACKLIDDFGRAEIRMIKYAEANAGICAIPVQVVDQLKAGHKNTEAVRQKVCAVATQIGGGRDDSGRPLVGDFEHWINKQVP